MASTSSQSRPKHARIVRRLNRQTMSEDYYERKARKNAETIDFVVTHWKGILAALFIIGFLADAFG